MHRYCSCNPTPPVIDQTYDLGVCNFVCEGDAVNTCGGQAPDTLENAYNIWFNPDLGGSAPPPPPPPATTSSNPPPAPATTPSNPEPPATTPGAVPPPGTGSSSPAQPPADGNPPASNPNAAPATTPGGAPVTAPPDAPPATQGPAAPATTPAIDPVPTNPGNGGIVVTIGDPNGVECVTSTLTRTIMITVTSKCPDGRITQTVQPTVIVEEYDPALSSVATITVEETPVPTLVPVQTEPVESEPAPTETDADAQAEAEAEAARQRAAAEAEAEAQAARQRAAAEAEAAAAASSLTLNGPAPTNTPFGNSTTLVITPSQTGSEGEEGQANPTGAAPTYTIVPAGAMGTFALDESMMGVWLGFVVLGFVLF